MGFNQDHDNAARKPRTYWIVGLLVALFCVAVAAGGDNWRELLKYDRLAIEQGQWWRLLSGHFSHLNPTHLGLNMAGLLLAFFLVGENLSARSWLLVVLFGIVGIDAGFWFLDENLIWYVGLSGLLHSILVAGAVAGLVDTTLESIVILAIVFGKVAFEQIVGPVPGSEATTGGPVVVNAHFYGAIAGCVGLLLLARRVIAERSI